MKPTARHPSIAPAFLIGAVALFIAGWMVAGKPAPAAETAASSAGNDRPAREARPYGRYQIPHHAVMRVRAIRQLADPAERMRATIALANSIPLSELGDWLEGRWFPNAGDYNLSLFNKLLERRWQAEDPEGLAAWRIHQGGSKAMSILADWARNDPERLLAHFRENPDHDRAAQFLGEIAAKHPDLALVRVRELIAAGTPLNGMMNHQIGEALRRIAAADPARAAELLDSLPTSFARHLEVGLAEHSLKQSLADGIRALWERPDGWDLFNSASVENKGELKHSSPHD